MWSLHLSLRSLIHSSVSYPKINIVSSANPNLVNCTAIQPLHYMHRKTCSQEKGRITCWHQSHRWQGRASCKNRLQGTSHKSQVAHQNFCPSNCFLKFTASNRDKSWPSELQNQKVLIFQPALIGVLRNHFKVNQLLSYHMLLNTPISQYHCLHWQENWPLHNSATNSFSFVMNYYRSTLFWHSTDPNLSSNNRLGNWRFLLQAWFIVTFRHPHYSYTAIIKLFHSTVSYQNSASIFWMRFYLKIVF